MRRSSGHRHAQPRGAWHAVPNHATHPHTPNHPPAHRPGQSPPHHHRHHHHRHHHHRHHHHRHHHCRRRRTSRRAAAVGWGRPPRAPGRPTPKRRRPTSDRPTARPAARQRCRCTVRRPPVRPSVRGPVRPDVRDTVRLPTTVEPLSIDNELHLLICSAACSLRCQLIAHPSCSAGFSARNSALQHSVLERRVSCAPRNRPRGSRSGPSRGFSRRPTRRSKNVHSQCNRTANHSNN